MKWDNIDKTRALASNKKDFNNRVFAQKRGFHQQQISDGEFFPPNDWDIRVVHFDILVNQWGALSSIHQNFGRPREIRIPDLDWGNIYIQEIHLLDCQKTRFPVDFSIRAVAAIYLAPMADYSYDGVGLAAIAQYILIIIWGWINTYTYHF